jgi:hypothetical protein
MWRRRQTSRTRAPSKRKQHNLQHCGGRDQCSWRPLLKDDTVIVQNPSVLAWTKSSGLHTVGGRWWWLRDHYYPASAIVKTPKRMVEACCACVSKTRIGWCFGRRCAHPKPRRVCLGRRPNKKGRGCSLLKPLGQIILRNICIVAFEQH